MTNAMNKESHLDNLLSDTDDPGGSEVDLELHELQNRSLRRRSDPALVRVCKPLNVVFLLLAISITSFWAGTYLPFRKSTLDGICAAHTTQWSPVLRDVDVKYGIKQFNGSFLEENIYRQVGTPEVDKAWDDLGVNFGAGIISYEEGIKSGLGRHFVKRAKKYGGGFIVNLEGLHHLHCLNLIRQSLYFNYEHYRDLKQHAFKNEGEILRKHVTHCLDAVRQVLMCNVDTGVLGQVWTVDSDGKELQAFPDFNSKHMCKNFDDIKEWSRKILAPSTDDLPNDYLEPPADGDVVGPIP
ncbi:hypothetical protein JDV02_009098 [Purpureocillium takamizusanense]|uniref:Tat pathway signal sequence n=1 Tax=Purpureocillium takamizusanense TaxID=2060973 RepID=A0A9Q8VFX6_9HYPO|nr:uncharacterized protein JDV02_009098 [Purpureocillium takamizusanense]UNI23267.1 hypothetical protein JDV02_009098 [Purpureocillium takamizusanense]